MNSIYKRRVFIVLTQLSVGGGAIHGQPQSFDWFYCYILYFFYSSRQDVGLGGFILEEEEEEENTVNVRIVRGATHTRTVRDLPYPLN